MKRGDTSGAQFRIFAQGLPTGIQVALTSLLSSTLGVVAGLIVVNCAGQYLHLWKNLNYVAVWVAMVTVAMVTGVVLKRILLIGTIATIFALGAQAIAELDTPEGLKIWNSWSAYVFIMLTVLFSTFILQRMWTSLNGNRAQL